jgi:hypothetical protein
MLKPILTGSPVCAAAGPAASVPTISANTDNASANDRFFMSQRMLLPPTRSHWFGTMLPAASSIG